jgi:hypothetical protein
VVFRAILPYFSLTPVQFYVVSLEMIGLCYFFFSSLPPFILFFLR